MIPILYKSAEVDFTTNGLGLLNDIYSVDIQEQRNGLLTLTASYPTNAKHYKEIETGRIIYAKPNPLDGAQAFRIVKTELDISGYNLNIEADHITYDLTHNLVKEVHLQGDGQNAMTHLQNATVTPHLFRFVSDLQHLGDSRLQYVNPMEAIAGTEGSILQIWGGELHRDNRTVSMLSRRGRDNFTTFRLGKNINGLKYTVDMSNVTTRIVPTVTKSDATDNDKAYFVVGDTVDSKNLNKYPNVYIQHVDMGEKVTINEGETDEQIKAKIDKQAKNWFTQSANTGIDLPQVTVEIDVTSLQDSADYQEKFRNLESVGLTDTVSVYVPEFNVNVTAIVNELHYDPVAERVTSLVVGTSKKSFADNNSNALAELQNSITQIRQDATTAIVSSNGKNTNYYGTEEPAHPVEGDLWFKQVGDETYLMIFKDGRWQEWVSTKTQEEIAKKVDDAIQKAKEYTDELNEKQAEEVQKFQSEANSALSEAAAERNSLSIQADTMLDSANSYADSMAGSAATYGKAQASNVLSQAQSELATAKQELGSEVSKAQADITATNKELAGKVSQTDFDKTTGDLSTKYGQIKATADAVTTDVAKYKDTNDKKVSANTANIATMSDQITSKVSKTDFDKKTGELNGKFTQQQQTVDSISQTVTELQAKVNAQGQVNQLLNTEFNPDLEGWTVNSSSGSSSPYKSAFDKNVQANMVGFNTVNASANTYATLQQDVLIGNAGGGFVSLSWQSWAPTFANYANLWVRFYDSSNKQLDEQVKQWTPQKSDGSIVDGLWTRQKFEGIAIPSGSVKISVFFQAREGINAYLVRPMLVFDSTIGDTYMPGSYSGMNTSTVLELFKDNWALGIADNAGRLISGINGDKSGTVIQGKKLVINSDTTINGKAFIDGSVIKNASIGTAQIGKAAIGSAQIINVDVSKISGNIANFITGNIKTLNSHVLYGDTGHLGTTDTGRVINKQDNHLQLASKGMYNSANDRAQVELLSHTNDIDANMRGSFNYYSDVRKGHGLGIRLVQNQILAIDEDGGSKNLYLSPYAGGQVRIVSRDLNSYYDIAAANFRVSSQRKFKSDIKPLDDGALDIVNKTNIKSYTKNGVSEIGVIADEAPNELLSDDGKFINIYDYTSVLYKAVQELSAQVKELQDERSNN